jgi:hypothetical protein
LIATLTVVPPLVRTGKTPLPTATLTVLPDLFNTGNTVGKVDHDGLVPSVFKNLPELPVCEGYVALPLKVFQSVLDK